MKDLRQQFEALSKRHSVHSVRANTVKLMLDGVMETKTAYMHEPYCCNRHGHPQNETIAADESQRSFGISNFQRDYLSQVVVALDEADFQIHV